MAGKEEEILARDTPQTHVLVILPDDRLACAQVQMEEEEEEEEEERT